MTKNFYLVYLFVFLLISCSVNSTSDSQGIQEVNLSKQAVYAIFPVGTMYAESNVAAHGAYAILKQTLRKNDAISIVAELDHAKNARSVGLDLNYTEIIFFGNPVLGTPLMQENQLVGLDLPQKILFYTDEKQEDYALFNSENYLRSRHALGNLAELDKISEALENLTEKATKAEVMAANQQTVPEGYGIITKESTKNFEQTYSDLIGLLKANSAISIIAELDHQKNAASVGLELEPTRIVLFGNPNLGTPLMQEAQTIGLDLPQKMLVWQNDLDGDGADEVYISYNDPETIAERHGITKNDETIWKIKNALETLSNKTAGI